MLVLGDFHGQFPKKFEKIIKKEKIDILVSNGDYFPFYYRELWFKHCYGTNTMLWEVVGKNKYKELILKDLRDGEKALSKLNDLSIPVITIYGNVDYTRKIDTVDYKIDRNHFWAWDEHDFFSKIIKKYQNIHEFTYSYFKFQDYIFIGAYGGSSPGKVRSRNFMKHKKILNKLFEKFRKENKEGKVIFISHNVPYNTKLDKIGNKAHESVRGKHYGSKLVRKIIDQYHPILHAAGHIHESRGLQKVGKTFCVNPGAAHDGMGAIVELGGRYKVKAKLIR